MGIFDVKNKGKKEIEGYNRIADDVFINNATKEIIINGNKYDFTQLLDVKLVINGINRNIFSGVQPNKNFVTGVGISKELINQIDIEIKTKNIQNPFIVVHFLKLGIKIGYDRNGKKYKEMYNQAQKCLSMLELIIQENKNK